MPVQAEVVEYDGWLYGEEADEAIEKAQKYEVPVVIMAAQRNTNCPKCIGAGRVMSVAPAHKKMVRVMYYVDKGDLNSAKTTELFRKVAGQVKNPSGWHPDTYYTTADGQAMGFVPYEEAAEAREEGSAVLQINEWATGVPGELAKADRSAERGRYADAMEKIDELVEQDAKISHLIQIHVGKAEKTAEQPETPVSRMFPAMRETKLKEYEAMAQAELDAARKMVADEKLREARRSLTQLARGPEDFATTEPAKKLLEEVDEKLRG